MATKFMSGTELFMFECLMQQTPNMSRANQEEKRFKAQYIGVLKDYMREYGYGDIRKRVLNSLDKFIFDEFIFCNEEHRDTFWRMHTRWAKNADKKNLDAMAIIYLLSTHREFGTILANYVSNPLYVLPKTYSGGNDEEKYNIYHAVKMIAGMESGLEEADLFEDEIIDDKVLCLIINAKFICRYGINGYQDKKNRRKEPYINNSSKHRRNQKLFSYKGQTLRIK